MVTILLIRHAEKPVDAEVRGVDISGGEDSRSLTPRGWQRAGAWAELFASSPDRAVGVASPATIFASAPASHHELSLGAGGSKSRRPLETVTPLADRLDLDVDLRFSKGDEAALAKAVALLSGTVLVCWQHENIAAIANALSPTPEGVPAEWPDECFNAVFCLSRDGGAGAPWAFRQAAPVMLKGDSGDML